jgi:hypothetical protein
MFHLSWLLRLLGYSDVGFRASAWYDLGARVFLQMRCCLLVGWLVGCRASAWFVNLGCEVYF